MSRVKQNLKSAEDRYKNWCPQRNSNPCNTSNLLHKLTVSQIAELSKLSKSYVSQVRQGRRPPSEKINQAFRQYYEKTNRIDGLKSKRAVDLFIKSRCYGTSPRTIVFYRQYPTRLSQYSA